jgi:hypothetical protein
MSGKCHSAEANPPSIQRNCMKINMKESRWQTTLMAEEMLQFQQSTKR